MDFDLLLNFVLTYLYVFIIIVVYWYLLTSYGLYKLALKEELQYPWFAWIPFLKYFIFSKLIGGEIWGNNKADFWLVFASLAAPIGFYLLITGFGLAFPVLLLVIIYLYFENAYYQLFVKYVPDKAKMYIILSVLFPIILNPIFTVLVSKESS